MRWLKPLLVVVAVLHVLVGLYALYDVAAVARLMSLQPVTAGARGELRAVFGGLVLAVGTVILRGAAGGVKGRQWLLAAAFAYGGLVIGRFVSLGLDGFAAHTLVGGLVEAAMMGLLLFAAVELGPGTEVPPPVSPTGSGAGSRESR